MLAAGLGAAVLASAGIAGAQHRQVDAHEHGRGRLNIAIEGGRVSMELEAPGVDIVGFEHAAKSDKQKAAVESAKQALAAPQGLFKLPAAAGCTLKQAKVELEGADDDHAAKDHDHKDGDKSDHAADKHDDHKADHADEHSGFRAEYAFDCTAPQGLTGIVFDYFKAFGGAQRLDVTVVTPKGQSKFEVSRARPRIDLGGMM
jgi:hypothetical protein